MANQTKLTFLQMNDTHGYLEPHPELFAADPYQQMGGYVKRCLGLTLYVKFENLAKCVIRVGPSTK
jgi:hypothetical protein